MANSDEIRSLIAQLDEVSSPASSASNIQELISNVLDTLDLKPSQLASALEVSQASVSRWLSGGNIPHQRHFRALQELLRSRSNSAPKIDGIDFHGRKLAIYGVDTFFSRAQEAKNVFILKKLLGFQAGVNASVHQQLREVFVANPEVKVMYAFPFDSETAMTFLNLRRNLAPDWPENIFWKELDTTHELMQLFGELFVSSFIIEHKDGRIEIMLEVPVKTLKPIDEFDLATYTSLFLELSDSHKYRMWVQWRSALEKIEWDSIRTVEKSVGQVVVRS